jgi:hypothetical protein
MRLAYILHPPKVEMIEGFQQGFFFQWKGLATFYTAHPSLYIGLSTILFIVFAVYFNFIINREKLFARKSFIPGIAFMLYSSFLPSHCIFSTVFIANIFIFLAFAHVLSAYNLNAPQKIFFNAGIFLGLAILFYFPCILMFILFILLMLMVRPFKWQEFLAYIFGVITPFYIGALFLFLLGKWNNYKKNLDFRMHFPTKIISTPIFSALCIITVIMLVYGLFLVNQSQSKNTTGVRKKWNCVGFYFVFASIVGLFSVTFPSLTWLMAITPFSIVLSQSLQNNKEKFNTFTFYFLLIMLFSIQWIMQLKYIL